SAGGTGGGTPPTDWPCQTGPLTSTKGRNCVLKKPSSRPPGDSSLVKSSSGMSFEAPALNGYRPATAWWHKLAGPLGALKAFLTSSAVLPVRTAVPLVIIASS